MISVFEHCGGRWILFKYWKSLQRRLSKSEIIHVLTSKTFSARTEKLELPLHWRNVGKKVLKLLQIFDRKQISEQITF